MDTLLHKVRESVHLQTTEKEQIKAALSAHMEQYPLRGGEKKALLSYQDSATLLGYQLTTFRRLTLAVLALLIIGTGTSFAAEGALPGDSLYTLKINVNEKVRTSLARSGAARAGVQAKLAARRLEEIEQLAHQGKLTTETRSDLEGAFLAHTDDANKNIQLSAQGTQVAVAAEVSSDLESTLASHERILADLSVAPAPAAFLPVENEVFEKNEVRVEAQTHPELRVVLQAVREQRKRAVALRRATEAKVVARPLTSDEDVDATLQRATVQIDDANNFFTQREGRVSEEASGAVRARLRVADQVVQEGKARLRAGKRGEAFTLSQKARRMAREVQVAAEVDTALERPDGRHTPPPFLEDSPIEMQQRTEIRIEL